MNEKCNCSCDDNSKSKIEEKDKDPKNPYSKEALNKLEDDSYMNSAEDIEEKFEDLNDTSGGVGGWGGT